MYHPHYNGDIQNNADFADELDLPNLVDGEEPELQQLDEKKDIVLKTDVLSINLSVFGEDGIRLEECCR